MSTERNTQKALEEREREETKAVTIRVREWDDVGAAWIVWPEMDFIYRDEKSAREALSALTSGVITTSRKVIPVLIVNRLKSVIEPSVPGSLDRDHES